MSKRKNGSRLLSTAALAVILGAGTPGLAEPSKVVDNASLHAEVERERRFAELRKRGNTALREGRPLEALKVWREAYTMVPLYEVACAIGRIEMLERANAVEGALWLTRCVNLAPIPEHGGKKSAEEIAAQEKEIALRDLARARVGAIRLVTNEGAEVRLDERVLGKAPLGDEVFVEPGVLFRITVSFGEQSRWVRVKLAPGESQTLDLSLPPQPPPTSPDRTLLIGGIVAGAAGLGLAIGFGGAAIHLRGQEREMTDSLLSEGGNVSCLKSNVGKCADLKEMWSRETAFTVASMVGLPVAVAGSVMITYALVSPPSKASEPKVQAAFLGGPGGGALVLKGRF